MNRWGFWPGVCAGVAATLIVVALGAIATCPWEQVVGVLSSSIVAAWAQAVAGGGAILAVVWQTLRNSQEIRRRDASRELAWISILRQRTEALEDQLTLLKIEFDVSVDLQVPVQIPESASRHADELESDLQNRTFDEALTEACSTCVRLARATIAAVEQYPELPEHVDPVRRVNRVFSTAEEHFEVTSKVLDEAVAARRRLLE